MMRTEPNYKKCVEEILSLLSSDVNDALSAFAKLKVWLEELGLCQMWRVANEREQIRRS